MKWGLECVTQNGNAGDWLLLQYIFASLCAASELSLTGYFLSVHFLSLNIFGHLPWSMTPFCLCSLGRCFWNYLARITSLFWVLVCIYIWKSNYFEPGSWTFHINWYIYIYILLIPLISHAQLHLCLESLQLSDTAT